LIRATLDLAGGAVASRSQVFEGDYLLGRVNRNFDVAPDGKSFLFTKGTAALQLLVRLNAVHATERE
jgi:hypothetical protein